MYGERKQGCCLFSLIKGGLLVFVVIFIGALFMSPTETSSSNNVQATARPAQVASQSDDTQATAPTSEPTSLQGWAETVAQSVYGSPDFSYPDLISVECQQVDGESAPMIILNVKYPGTFFSDNDERMSSFLYNVMRVNWEFADLAKAGKIEYGSVFVHGRSMFVDKYGNEFEADAASIRIKASEAAKVNWSFSTVTGDMMPGIAVSFGINPVIREGLSFEYQNKIRQ